MPTQSTLKHAKYDYHLAKLEGGEEQFRIAGGTLKTDPSIIIWVFVTDRVDEEGIPILEFYTGKDTTETVEMDQVDFYEGTPRGRRCR